ncbi:MAG: SbcC/MukB-like Walker B domain-containing protein, partial [Desulfuromusa sp.]|nr:SbcC/MukB-like Walker B domain-containing protein [Desulfuromusa sp.]
LQSSNDLKTAENHSVTCQENYLKAKKELESLREALRDARQEILALRKSDRDLDAIEAAGKVVRALIDTYNEIRNIQAEIQGNASKVDLAMQAVETQKGEMQNAKQRRKELFSVWLEGQAVRIAETLQSGHPCPVCGSIEHPEPQQRHTGKNITDEQLTELDEQIVRIEELLAKKKEELTKLQDVQNKRFTRKETLEQTLGDEKNVPFDILTQRREALKETYRAVSRNKQAIETLEQQITSQEKLERENQVILEREQGAWQRAGTDVARLAAVVAALEREVAEQYREPGALAKEIKNQTRKIEDLESEQKQTEEKYRTANETCTAINEKVSGAADDLRRCNIAFDQSNTDYNSRLGTSSFSNEATFLAAILTDNQILELKNSIESFNTTLAMADDRHKKAVSGAKGLTFANLDELQITLDAANAELNQRKENRIALQTTLEAKEKELKRAEQEQKTIDALDKNYQSLGRIAEVANGSNNKKTSFHRFILQTLLDEVLEVASHRLKKMTNQKFYLSRDDGLRDARKQSGLDLILTDTFTGTQRSVKSLSGGEGFLAALSLALGLSDVVQAHAGGIKLDTIFIDEGFGSLSPDALDQVVDVLNSLSGEGRLVGIISHVPELKQQITAQLQVKEGLAGSSASFRV